MLKQEFTTKALELAKTLPTGTLRVIILFDDAPSHYVCEKGHFVPVPRKYFYEQNDWPILKINQSNIDVEVK